jgi:hypothetical protein
MTFVYSITTNRNFFIEKIEIKRDQIVTIVNFTNHTKP